MAPDEGRAPAYRILTPRLAVRCWDPADAPRLKEAVDTSLEHLRPWMPWAAHHPQPLQGSIDLLRRFRGSFDLGQDYVYGIFTRDESVLIGGSGLHARGGEGSREIGYWIRADQINQGYATEVAAALTRVGFEIEKLRRMGIHCVVENARSAAIPAKLGYVHEATLRRRIRANDSFHDEMVWTLLAEEYANSPASRAVYEAYDAAGQRIMPES